MNYTTGTTQSNPMMDNKPYIEIKLEDTDQIIEAVYHSPLSLDRREERPNIEIGTEVGLLYDDIDNFYVIGATQQKIKPSPKKARRFNNNDEFEVQTNTLNIHNDSTDIISILSDFMDAVKAMESLPNTDSAGDSVPPIGHDKKGDIGALKAKLDAYKP